MLNSLREQAGVQEASLYTQRGKLIAFSGNERAGMTPDPPSATALSKLRLQQTYAAIEAIADRGLYLRVIAPVNVVSLSDEARAIQLMQPVPEGLARDAETVQAGYSEYQELLLSRRGLKRLYGITLTLTLLLALSPRSRPRSCCRIGCRRRSTCSSKARARSPRATSASARRTRAGTSWGCSRARSTT